MIVYFCPTCKRAFSQLEVERARIVIDCPCGTSSIKFTKMMMPDAPEVKIMSIEPTFVDEFRHGVHPLDGLKSVPTREVTFIIQDMREWFWVFCLDCLDYSYTEEYPDNPKICQYCGSKNTLEGDLC